MDVVQGNVGGQSDRFVSQVAAALEAARVWRTFRQPTRTIQAHDSALAEASADPALSQEEWETAQAISAPVLRTMAERVAKLWDRYQLKLSDPAHDMDEATDQLVSGVHRELERIVDLNGSIPTQKMSEWLESLARM